MLSSRCCFELGRLIRDRKCVEDVTKIARHDHREIWEILIDPVVCESVLWEVIGTDFFATIPGSDECQSSGSLFFRFFLFLHSEDTRLEDRYGSELVLEL